MFGPLGLAAELPDAAPGRGHRWELLVKTSTALQALSVMVRVCPWPREAARGHVEALTATWRELVELGGGDFRLKPKFHLLRHLVADVAPVHGPLPSTGVTRTRAGDAMPRRPWSGRAAATPRPPSQRGAFSVWD